MKTVHTCSSGLSKEQQGCRDILMGQLCKTTRLDWRPADEGPTGAVYSPAAGGSIDVSSC